MPEYITEPEDFPKAFEEALNTGDLGRIAELYDPTATLRISSGEVRSGMAAVRNEMSNLIEAKAHITNTLRHTLRHGDIALILVDYVLRIGAPDGSRMEMRGTATNVIQRTDDRGWRLMIANPQGTA